MIIDCQVHAYERDHPAHPWAGHVLGLREATGEQVLAQMALAGVDAAILVSMWSAYRYDASYATAVRDAHPGRIALVKPVDYADPAVAEVVGDWAATPGAVAIRIFELPPDPAHPGLRAALTEAGRRGLAVNLLCFGQLEAAAALARAHPDVQFAIDHIGLRPPVEPPVHAEPFRELPQVLALAQHPNVAMKVSGLCVMSAGPFPFDDIWAPLWRVFDAFGFDRCMWGSDWTRATPFLTWREAADAFRLHGGFSEAERAALMGGTLQKIYGWSPVLGSG